MGEKEKSMLIPAGKSCQAESGFSWIQSVHPGWERGNTSENGDRRKKTGMGSERQRAADTSASFCRIKRGSPSSATGRTLA